MCSEESTNDDTKDYSIDFLNKQSFFERYIISDEVLANGGQASIVKGFDLQR